MNRKSIAGRTALAQAGRLTLAKAWRGAAIALAAGLLSCGESPTTAPAPPAGGGARPQSVAEQRLEQRRAALTAQRQRLARTPQQRIELRRRFAGVLPPQAYAALAQLGLPAGGGSARGDKGASVSLPAYVPATQEYSPGDLGWIAKSSDVVEGPFGGFDMAPSGTQFPDNFSYIIYRIDDVTELAQALTLSLGGPNQGDIGLAIYNWSWGALGRWEPLFYGPAVSPIEVDLSEDGDWTNAGDDVAIVVFCLNPATVNLSEVALLNVPANDPPYAILMANPASGQAPLSTTLDASFSSDQENAIVTYRFDPLGDGDFTDQAEPTLDFTYSTPGIYQPVLEVVDAGGLTSQATTKVIVAPSTYSEVEDNDEQNTGNDLPAIPFDLWSGNCGKGGNYNDDTQDWFRFDAAPGDEVNFLLQYADNNQNAVMYLELYDANGFPLTVSQPAGAGEELLTYTFDTWELGPFSILVYCGLGNSDYYLGATHYDEVEHNDAPDQADILADLNGGTLTGWKGSLGDNPPDYEGYDGDSVDWASFGQKQLAEGTEIDLNLTYDSSTANIGFTLFNTFGTPLISSADGDGSEDLAWTVGPNEQPYFLQIAASSGYSDYILSGDAPFPNPGFDEQENNDDFPQANQFPAFPFADFSGNVGSGGSYDGDYEDYFKFNASVGDIIKFTITPTNRLAGLSAYLEDSNINDYREIGSLAAIDPETGVVTISAMIRNGLYAPFFLVVYAYDGPDTDYSITTELGTYDEVEDNDSFAEANPFPDGAFSFFAGSLGTGGSNYDGDSLDVYSFTANEGDTLFFGVYYDQFNGSVTGVLKDAEGDELASALDFGNGYFSVSTDTPLDAEDIAPYYLELSSTSGYSDYWVARWEIIF